MTSYRQGKGVTDCCYDCGPFYFSNNKEESAGKKSARHYEFNLRTVHMTVGNTICLPRSALPGVKLSFSNKSAVFRSLTSAPLSLTTNANC